MEPQVNYRMKLNEFAQRYRFPPPTVTITPTAGGFMASATWPHAGVVDPISAFGSVKVAAEEDLAHAMMVAAAKVMNKVIFETKAAMKEVMNKTKAIQQTNMSDDDTDDDEEKKLDEATDIKMAMRDISEQYFLKEFCPMIIFKLLLKTLGNNKLASPILDPYFKIFCTTDESGWRKVLAELWSKLMHAANGNCIINFTVGKSEVLGYEVIDCYSPACKYLDSDFVELIPMIKGDDVVIFEKMNQITRQVANEMDIKGRCVDSFKSNLLVSRSIDQDINHEMHATNGNILPVQKPQRSTRKENRTERTAVKKVEKVIAQAEGKIRRSNITPKPSLSKKVESLRVQNRVMREAGPMLSKMSNSIRHVLLATMSPLLTTPFRWSSEYTTLPTAVAKPFTIENCNWPLTSGTAHQMPLNRTAGVCFRDPVRSYIIYEPNPNATPYGYNIWTQSDNSASSTYAVTAVRGVETEIPFAYAISSTAYQPHGTTLGVGITTAHTGGYFWLDTGAAINVTSTIAATGSIDLIFYKAIEKSERQAGSILAISGTSSNSFTAGSSGYYRWTYHGNAASTTSSFSYSFIANITGSGDIFCHRMLPHLELKFQSVDQIRMNACTIMYTNTSKDISRSGNIVSAQVPGDEDWYTYATQDLGNLTKVTGAKTQQLKTGAYGFMKPSESTDFDLLTPITVVDDDVFTKLTFPIFGPNFLIFVATTNDDEGKEGYWTFTYGVEFVTLDQWFTSSVSNYDQTVFKDALSKLKTVEQFHENPLHLSDIKKAIGGIIQGIKDYGPLVMQIAKMF